MAKTKTPFLSLGAKGTVGGVLTSQKRGRATLLRETPVPTDPYSLPQAYQRWLYQDYAYQWTLESETVKQTYRTQASRYHITGFSLWMREHLQDLPDIGGYYKMDDNLGATTKDSSRNGLDAIVIGASPAAGLIDGCFSFDGLNDTLNCGNSMLLNPISEISLEIFAYFTDLGTNRTLISRFDVGVNLPYILERTVANKMQFILGPAPNRWCTTITNIEKDRWYHILATSDGRYSKIYLDGLLDKTTDFLTYRDMQQSAINTYIASLDNNFQFMQGFLDHGFIYKRELDDVEALRHSQRRYPL